MFGAASHPVTEVGQTAEEHDQDEHRQHQVGGGVVGDVVERDNLVHEPHEGALGVQARINYRINKYIYIIIFVNLMNICSMFVELESEM